ncbi:MAG: hypothetical protein HN509_06475 [Halobacteriovoraceae bacterium]|jgi:hypothetical protein|nr:hypothetical protein [Halobacteriovoraceae bacterium]MBT5092613.1 hypothetical protein [Halobacteriovoraceae bacterium]
MKKCFCTLLLATIFILPAAHSKALVELEDLGPYNSKLLKSKSLRGHSARDKALKKAYKRGQITREQYKTGRQVNSHYKGKWNPQLDGANKKTVKKWLKENKKNIKNRKYRRRHPASNNAEMQGSPMPSKCPQHGPRGESSWWDIFN